MDAMSSPQQQKKSSIGAFDRCDSAGQDPAILFDSLRKWLNLKNDAALARVLAVSQPILSKMRVHKRRASPALLLRIHDETNLSIGELRAIMAGRVMSKPASLRPAPAGRARAEHARYDPVNLLDRLSEILGVRNDAALSRILAISPSILSKMRHHQYPLSAAILIRMHDASHLSIHDLRALGDRPERRN